MGTVRRLAEEVGRGLKAVLLLADRFYPSTALFEWLHGETVNSIV